MPSSNQQGFCFANTSTSPFRSSGLAIQRKVTSSWYYPLNVRLILKHRIQNICFTRSNWPKKQIIINFNLFLHFKFSPLHFICTLIGTNHFCLKTFRESISKFSIYLWNNNNIDKLFKLIFNIYILDRCRHSFESTLRPLKWTIELFVKKFESFTHLIGFLWQQPLEIHKRKFVITKSWTFL